MKEYERVEDIVENQSELYPDSTAYIFENQKISYIGLVRRAKEIKDDLRNNGVNEHSIVAFLLDKSLDYISYLYGVWKNKCVYVPLNHNDDSDRMYLILNELNPDLIITNHNNLENLKKFNFQGTILCIDGEEKKWYKRDCSGKKHRSVDENLAYIIFTSGTTGHPKGVCVAHSSILNFVKETVRMFEFDRNTVLLCVKPLHFDASFTDLLCPQYAGGTTVLSKSGTVMPRVLMKKINTYNVTHLSLSPILLQLLTENNSKNIEWSKSIKTISVGGDAVSFDKLQLIHNQLPGVKFYNRYGPTEATVVCSAFYINEWESINKLSIGKPLDGVNFYVLDENTNPVSEGETGELYVGGIQTMQGYWNNEKVTSQVLFNNLVENDILYKTGDLVYKGGDGNYYFIGRNGSIIKRNGYRISVLEVEAALSKCNFVVNCACLSVGEAGDEKLIAIIETKQGMKTNIIEYLKKCLPVYMLPDDYYIVEKMIYNSNGKVDRKYLQRAYKQSALSELI